MHSVKSLFSRALKHLRGDPPEPVPEGPAATRPSLACMPAELVLDILYRLPPLSRKALSQTCRRFRNFPELRDAELTLESERFEFLCMLERDGALSKLVCAGCKRVHKKSCFAKNQLRESPENRYCVASLPVLQICSARTLSFNEAKENFNLIRKLPQESMPDSPKWRMIPCEHGPQYEVPGHFWFTTRFWPTKLKQLDVLCLFPTRCDDIPSKETVKEALRDLDIRICPHMEVSDPRILDTYYPIMLNRTSARDVIYNTVVCPQRSCRTKAGLSYPSRSCCVSHTVLQLRVVRELGSLRSPNSAAWKAQTRPVYPLASGAITAPQSE
ncbi:hypothetical protein PABG_05804 [Paracoccidioides brasiliensis Pb03]|nr:hypothetical protein PABG_05804 [Paracoccidioides brasiliensis Pb03]